MSKRIFYAITQAGFAKDGTNAFIAVHALQSIGINTSFNLAQVFEHGQLAIYELIEQVPDIQVTMEKALDGSPLLYHLATNGATSGTLPGRSNIRPVFCMSVFQDTQECSSGAPVAEVYLSGLYVSSLAYNFPVDGFFTESVTLVGNSKVWRDVQASGGALFSGAFTSNADVSPNSTGIGGGIQTRQRMLFVPYTGNPGPTGFDANGRVLSYCTVLPTDIPGITSSGTNALQTDNTFLVPIQSINVSTDLGREAIYHQGRKYPYHRYVTFPIEVRTDIELLVTRMDNVQATEAGGNNGAPAGYNVGNQTIRIQCQDGTRLDLGTANKLSTMAWSGGDARSGGGNVTARYSYVGYNNLNVYSPADPSGL